MSLVLDGTNGVDTVQDGSVREVDLNADVVRLGVGQTWQNMIGSRALGTTYTNTTGKPIMVCVGVTGTDGRTTLIVGGINVSIGYHGGQSEAGVEGIVPNNTTYSVSNPVGGTTIAHWSELR